jgi:hypothetical protein
MKEVIMLIVSLAVLVVGVIAVGDHVWKETSTLSSRAGWAIMWAVTALLVLAGICMMAIRG